MADIGEYKNGPYPIIIHYSQFSDPIDNACTGVDDMLKFTFCNLKKEWLLTELQDVLASKSQASLPTDLKFPTAVLPPYIYTKI
jgi:hypothetical protein